MDIASTELPLEDIIHELQQLAKLRPLKGEQQAQARELMSELKRRDFTNAEISRLTGWDESTIKQSYTRGVVAVSSAHKDRAIDLLAELAARGLTLDSVEDFLPLRADLDDRNVKSDEVAALLQEARRAGIQTGELVRLPGELKHADLSLAQLKEALSIVESLGKLGYIFENLHAVMEAAKTHANPNEFLRAVAGYNSVTEIEAELQGLNTEKEEREKTISALDIKIQALSSEKQKIQGSLDLITRLEKDGIDEPTLKNLVDMSAKYGGVRGVTEAVKSYATLADIQSKIKEAKKQHSEAETQLKQVQADFAHLMPVVKMVETLLYDLKFSIKAVKDLFRVAKTYGTPVEVLEAVGKYGDLTVLQKDINFLEGVKTKLEARIGVLESSVHNLEGKTEELTHTLVELVAPITSEVSKAISTIRTEVSEYSEKFGALKKEAEHLDDLVKLARIIMFVNQYPTEAKDISIPQILLLVSGARNICRVKGLNPKIYPEKELQVKYHSYATFQFELSDLLDWAVKDLLMELFPHP